MPQSTAATNPLFNDSPLKLGSFSTNLSGGGTISKMDGLLKAEWPATLELARLADEMKFEAIVPVGRWKGFGGETNFNGEGFEPGELKAKVDKYRNFARAEFGREIQVWSNAYVYHGDSEADGQALWDHAVRLGDWQGVTNMLTVMGVTSQLVPPPVLDFLKQHFIAGWAGYPLVGGKEQIVEGLAMLKKVGFDGILLTWPRWVEGMTRFRDEVMPLLSQAGLR